MTAPMPSVTRLRGPSARVRACSPVASASARSVAIGLVANRVTPAMWGPAGALPTAPGRPGLRAGRAALGSGRGEQVTAVAAGGGGAPAPPPKERRRPPGTRVPPPPPHPGSQRRAGGAAETPPGGPLLRDDRRGHHPNPRTYL